MQEAVNRRRQERPEESEIHHERAPIRNGWQHENKRASVHGRSGRFVKAQLRSYAPGYGGRHILGRSRRAWSGEASDNPDVLDEVYTPDALWHLPEQEMRSGEIKEFGPPSGRQME